MFPMMRKGFVGWFQERQVALACGWVGVGHAAVRNRARPTQPIAPKSNCLHIVFKFSRENNGIVLTAYGQNDFSAADEVVSLC